MSAPLEPQLALLQLTDSLFPSGAFTHSYGLEQLAKDGSVRTPAQLEAFVTSVLEQVLATADAPSCYRAAEAVRNNDLVALIEADRALFRTKAAEELRNATVGVGHRQLEEVAPYVEQALLQRYATAVRADRTLACQPAAFGAICAALGVDSRAAVAALLLNNVNGLLQASMKLLPVSHRDVQAILHRLRPEIAAIAAQITAEATAPLRSFHPVQEIASMRHVEASARMFAS